MTSRPSTHTSRLLWRVIIGLMLAGIVAGIAVGIPRAVRVIREAREPRGKRSKEDHAHAYLLQVKAGLDVYEGQGKSCTSLTQLVDGSFVSSFTLGYDVSIVNTAGLRAVALPTAGQGRPLGLTDKGAVVRLDDSAVRSAIQTSR